ncbi:hypothetical protein SAMN05444401_1211 [Clostridium amylolyticum]|uniref:Uncharacterized protein n=1 Tax=Clostridium amylolyticum TaxID=1121298 RepID=A0A1M6CRI7_9CLOT|nr:hypothetical protein [Clostridium amylolyticum]SHI63596.1 hypothetical protein SAMN05444401_1211 [Clostridium amylolyticum]
MLYLEFDDLRWINAYIGNQEQLTSNDLEHLKTFAFMWDMFEAKACKGAANAQSIADFVLKDLGLEKQNRTSSVIDAYFDYFHDRYVTEGKLNEIFIRMSRDTKETFESDAGIFNVKDFIGQNLLDKDSTEINKLLTCILIAYRWRSNFFLLDKNIINISHQYKNFNIANKLIAMILQQYRRNIE